jgi:hypothetical protein
MKTKKYHSVGSVPRSNLKIVAIDKIYTPNTPVHDYSLSWLGSDTSVPKFKSIFSANDAILK